MGIIIKIKETFIESRDVEVEIPCYRKKDYGIFYKVIGTDEMVVVYPFDICILYQMDKHAISSAFDLESLESNETEFMNAYNKVNEIIKNKVYGT